jgi:hypothetical protein
MRLAVRRQRNIAKVGMARRLGVRLYWMWRNGWEYAQCMIRVRICTSRCHSSCRRSRFSGLGTQIRGKLFSRSSRSSSRASSQSVFCLRTRLLLIWAASPIHSSIPSSAKQPLEPAGVAGGLHRHSYARSSRRQFPIKLLGFSCTVVQLPFHILSRFCVDKRDVLIARVIIHAYNDHVRLLSPEPMVLDKPQFTRV